MTEDEIRNMRAGRNLDTLIATKIMGFLELPFPAMPKYQKPSNDGVNVLFDVPNYSTSVSDAWEVVEKLQEDHPDYTFYIEKYNKDIEFWFRINDSSHGTWSRDGGEQDTRIADCNSPSLSLVICKTALLTLLKDE